MKRGIKNNSVISLDGTSLRSVSAHITISQPKLRQKGQIGGKTFLLAPLQMTREEPQLLCISLTSEGCDNVR